MRGPSKLHDLFAVFTALPRLETWPFNTLRVEGTKFVMLQTMLHTKTPLRYQSQEIVILLTIGGLCEFSEKYCE